MRSTQLLALAMISFRVNTLEAEADSKQAKPNQIAFAQFVNKRFTVLDLSGRQRDFIRRDYNFQAARFSSDGNLLAGIYGREVWVLDQRFETVWKAVGIPGSCFNLAVDSKTTKVAFLSELVGRETTLGFVRPSGEQEVLATFHRHGDDGSCGLSWSPEGEELPSATQDTLPHLRFTLPAGYCCRRWIRANLVARRQGGSGQLSEHLR